MSNNKFALRDCDKDCTTLQTVEVSSSWGLGVDIDVKVWGTQEKVQIYHLSGSGRKFPKMVSDLGDQFVSHATKSCL